jgi:Domain of unknown function (DUF4169)
MGDIVNMRQAKKLRARAAEKQTAVENRVRFGRTASQRASDREKHERDTADLDGKRLRGETKE